MEIPKDDIYDTQDLVLKIHDLLEDSDLHIKTNSLSVALAHILASEVVDDDDIIARKFFKMMCEDIFGCCMRSRELLKSINLDAEEDEET